jgi:hypothetical protein
VGFAARRAGLDTERGLTAPRLARLVRVGRGIVEVTVPISARSRLGPGAPIIARRGTTEPLVITFRCIGGH